MRVFQRIANARLRREVNDALRSRRGEQLFDALAIDEIELVERKAVAPLELLEARLLQPHVVVAVEIVEPDHLVAAVEQRLGGVESDEARGTGDEKFHLS